MRNVKQPSLTPSDRPNADPRIHVVGCEGDKTSELNSQEIEWNIPSNAQKGDLVLMYRSAPTSAICDAWEIVGPFNRYTKGNRKKRRPGLQAGLKRIARFKQPLAYDDLKAHPLTRKIPVVLAHFQGKKDITEDWFSIYQRLVTLNPKAKSALKRYVVE